MWEVVNKACIKIVRGHIGRLNRCRREDRLAEHPEEIKDINKLPHVPDGTSELFVTEDGRVVGWRERL